ncbi:MAG TPA: type I restriction enzyme HsdR N-terminal domain-containing protein, partial [Candidatus Deferrimicrobium sp.]|nr:type I restriction enzyme HsdR N-terminal domain-containing protein [Candidatus Deferrimicrobium sp.]
MPIWEEVIVHFELYRLLKNKILEGIEYAGVHFTNIIPQLLIAGGPTGFNQKADLVILANDSNNNELKIVIEVKAGKVNIDISMDNKADSQARGYAAALHCPYYILTDGEQISC